MDAIVVDKVFVPNTLEVNAFGLDLELGVILVFDQMAILDAFHLVNNSIGQHLLNQVHHENFLAVKRDLEFHF